MGRASESSLLISVGRSNGAAKRYRAVFKIGILFRLLFSRTLGSVLANVDRVQFDVERFHNAFQSREDFSDRRGIARCL